MDKKRKLLLVDDERNILGALSRVFRKDGYEIFRGDSGLEGLEILKEHEIGVIISDQRMPEMTGVEFLSQVKDLYPDTVRIVLSGYTDLQSVTDAINEGAIFKFLTKPWDDEQIRKHVKDAFVYHELKNENKRLTEELKGANEQLEKAFEKKSIEAGRNLHVLQIAQEILENLPVAVLGVGADGLIAAANKQANCLIAGCTSLVGNFAQDVLPDELQSCLNPERVNGSLNTRIQLSGVEHDVFVGTMGELSASDGFVVVINSVV